MEITEIRVKLMEREDRGNLLAFVSVTLDHALAIRDIKVIEVNHRLHMAMPSRTIAWRCPHCRFKNHWSAHLWYCGGCGAELPEEPDYLKDGQRSPFLDIAHPVTSAARLWLESAVLAAYRQQVNQPQPVASS